MERFTFAKIEKLPERLVVPYAEPFDLKVHLQKDTRGRRDRRRRGSVISRWC
jgi:hypothetical protein